MDEKELRKRIAEHLYSKFPARHLSTEVDRCLSAIKLWATRYGSNVDHSNRIVLEAINALCGEA